MNPLPLLPLLILPMAHSQGTGGGRKISVHDPDKTFVGQPRVTLEGWRGRPLELKDDGAYPDPVAHDDVYCAAIEGWSSTSLEVVVHNDTRSWTSTATLQPGGSLWVVVHADKATRLDVPVTGPNRPTGAPVGGSALGPMRAAPPGQPRDLAFYLVLLASFGLGAGGLTQWYRRHPGRPALPDGEAVSRPFTPIRTTAEDLPRHLRDAGWKRWAVLGPLPEGAGLDDVVPLEAGATPREVLQALENLALAPGPPVALLVSDREALDREDFRDPVERLEALVAGRCLVITLCEGRAPRRP
jgi:hypothetical protein